jgi:hypothetical protein
VAGAYVNARAFLWTEDAKAAGRNMNERYFIAAYIHPSLNALADRKLELSCNAALNALYSTWVDSFQEKA